VLDFWSEGGNLLTPNSRLSLRFADRLHSYSPIRRPEFDQYLIKDTDLSITNPAPEILIKMKRVIISPGVIPRSPGLSV